MIDKNLITELSNLVTQLTTAQMLYNDKWGIVSILKDV